MMPSTKAYLAATLVLYGAYIAGQDFVRTARTLGIFRTPQNTPVEPENLMVIEGTAHCEDLHYNAASNRLFAACEGPSSRRHSWFPPMAIFDDPVAAMGAGGSLHVINPETMKSQTLEFENFPGLIGTHGIDVIADPDRAGSAVYIFAVQHPPSPEYLAAAKSGVQGDFAGQKERGTVEIFHHMLGSPTVRHVRSVAHPLVLRPNDIFARSPTSFYVTNDHFYAEGRMRGLEDMYSGATWSNTVHVSISDLATTNSTAGIQADVALSGLHNSNGLGHGPAPTDIMVVQAIDGVMHIGKVPAGAAEITIVLNESVKVDSTLDNPYYFADPYANSTFDASGYVLAGLTRGMDLHGNARNPTGKDPIMVWHVKPTKEGDRSGKWEKKLLFEDDGARIRSASAAVLVATDPRLEQGRRIGWLFVSGFYSSNAIAVRMDLE